MVNLMPKGPRMHSAATNVAHHGDLPDRIRDLIDRDQPELRVAMLTSAHTPDTRWQRAYETADTPATAISLTAGHLTPERARWILIDHDERRDDVLTRAPRILRHHLDTADQRHYASGPLTTTVAGLLLREPTWDEDVKRDHVAAHADGWDALVWASTTSAELDATWVREHITGLARTEYVEHERVLAMLRIVDRFPSLATWPPAHPWLALAVASSCHLEHDGQQQVAAELAREHATCGQEHYPCWQCNITIGLLEQPSLHPDLARSIYTAAADNVHTYLEHVGLAPGDATAVHTGTAIGAIDDHDALNAILDRKVGATDARAFVWANLTRNTTVTEDPQLRARLTSLLREADVARTLGPERHRTALAALAIPAPAAHTRPAPSATPSVGDPQAGASLTVRALGWDTSATTGADATAALTGAFGDDPSLWGPALAILADPPMEEATIGEIIEVAYAERVT